jgi:hypothetical protein
MGLALDPISQGTQIGADIGQRVDPTAIIVAEMKLRNFSFVGGENWDKYHQGPQGGEIHYEIHRIIQMPLNTAYDHVAQRIAEIYQRLHHPFAHLEKMPDTERSIYMKRGDRPSNRVQQVLVDATGVGNPVVELITKKGVPVTPVWFTSGDKVTRVNGELHMAKAAMVSRLQVLLQQRRIHFPDDYDSRALVEELLNYEIKATDSGNLQTGVFKVGKHDDLATALGLATWEEIGGTLTIGDAPEALQRFFYGNELSDHPVSSWRG